MTHEQDPQGYIVGGKPEAKRMNPVWLSLMGLVGGLLLAVLMFSIFDMDSQEEQTPHNQPPAQPTTQTRLVAEAPLHSGLVGPPPAETPPAKLDEPKEPAQPALTAQQIAMLQEGEQLRQMRKQWQLQALQAPLQTLTANSRERTGQPVASSVGVNDSGTRVAASRDLPGANNDERKDKEAFLDGRSRQQADQWRLGHSRVAGAPCEIKTGTVIPGIMLTGINSDLPGKIIGQVSQNVYDTATGSMLIIPQGSKIIGVYDSRVAMGQERVLIAWNRIVFPDGSSVDIETMPGTDQAGFAGFEDEVNNHYFRIFGSAIIMSLIGGGMAYTVDSLNGNSGSQGFNENPTLQDEMGTALAAQLGQASLQLLQQNINIKPTLEIRPGFRFNIVLVKDMVFDAPYRAMR